jgi:hypothetical protein
MWRNWWIVLCLVTACQLSVEPSGAMALVQQKVRKVEQCEIGLIQAAKDVPEGRDTIVDLPTTSLSRSIGALPDLNSAEIDQLCDWLLAKNLTERHDIYVVFLLYVMRLYDVTPATFSKKDQRGVLISDGYSQWVDPHIFPTGADPYHARVTSRILWPWKFKRGRFELMPTRMFPRLGTVHFSIVDARKIDGRYVGGALARDSTTSGTSTGGLVN